MAKQTSSRRVEIGTRELFLAGIGAVSLGRKQALVLMDRAAGSAGQARARALEAFAAVRSELEARAQQVRDAAKPVEQVLREGAGRVQQGLQPVLERVGLAKRPAKRRRPAAKRPRKTASGRARKKAA